MNGVQLQKRLQLLDIKQKEKKALLAVLSPGKKARNG